MKIHEYQAKDLFRQFDIPVPEGQVAFTPGEAEGAARRIPAGRYVVKAQIHAGGRGKGGGVKLADSLGTVREMADQILDIQLVTPQTGPEGKKVKAVLVEEASTIQKEFYLGIVLDRSKSWPVVMASPDGGMNIEEVAQKMPDRILKVQIPPAIGLQPFHARRIAGFLGIPREGLKEAVRLMSNMYRLYVDLDCSLVEVNPLILTAENRVLALDAKITFDDNALFRHPELLRLRDLDEEDPLEIEASKYHLNYIKLDGDVGCMVNGAGLAMATMDIIKLHGAQPANFLDVGGGADAEAIENAFRILLSDTHVKAVLINIFGGILRCDLLAEGVVKAAEKFNVTVPIVIRMKGTNVERGKEILAASKLPLTVADTLEEAAIKVSEQVRQPVA